MDEGIEIARKWLMAMNEHDIDAMSALCWEDAVGDEVADPPPAEGRDPIALSYRGLFAGFPDCRSEIVNIFFGQNQVMAEVRKTFRPEFLNRVDDIIVFHELSREQIGEIVELMIKDLQKRLSERRLELTLTESAKTWIADTGFDPIFGARPLRRAIERYVENPLSNKLLSGEYKEGDTVIVDLFEGELVFRKKEKE